MGSSPLTFVTKANGARQWHVRVLGSVVLIEVGNLSLVDFTAQCSRKEVIEAEDGEAGGSKICAHVTVLSLSRF
jgi:hypothetical protein